MRIVRFQDGSSVYWGIAREGFVHHMPEAPFWCGDDGEIVGEIDNVTLLTPVDPGKIVCVGSTTSFTSRSGTRAGRFPRSRSCS